MKKCLSKLHHLTLSFWFIPSLVVVLMIAAAIGVIILDRKLAPIIGDIAWGLVIFEQEALRTFLATIAGSMMTVAGVVFSITILVLSQASEFYTSRILRNFMRNRNNQFVLGLFVGIFIFCLFLLANLHPTNNIIAATTGFALALLGVGFLISFIHSMSTSIQSSEIISNIEEETLQILKKIYPDFLNSEKEPLCERISGECIPGSKTGYIQSIDCQALIELAQKEQTILQLEKNNGDFVMETEGICLVTKEIDDELVKKINQAFVIGSYRTLQQDISFGIQQLVDIALKGLASGVNDVMTAQIAIDYLSSIYLALAPRKVVCDCLDDKEGKRRLLTQSWTFESLLELGFCPIIENARIQSSILRRIESSLDKIKQGCPSQDRIKAIEKLKKTVFM